ncbi:hypothetical protein C8R48DRAFT_754066, partial [Suillus tomentosus]
QWLSVAYLFNAWPSPSRACFPPLLSLSSLLNLPAPVVTEAARQLPVDFAPKPKRTYSFRICQIPSFPLLLLTCRVGCCTQ